MGEPDVGGVNNRNWAVLTTELVGSRGQPDADLRVERGHSDIEFQVSGVGERSEVDGPRLPVPEQVIERVVMTDEGDVSDVANQVHDQHRPLNVGRNSIDGYAVAGT